MVLKSDRCGIAITILAMAENYSVKILFLSFMVVLVVVLFNPWPCSTCNRMKVACTCTRPLHRDSISIMEMSRNQTHRLSFKMEISRSLLGMATELTCR